MMVCFAFNDEVINHIEPTKKAVDNGPNDGLVLIKGYSHSKGGPKGCAIIHNIVCNNLFHKNSCVYC